MLGSIFGSPIGKEPGEECVKDTSGGSGPYKAAYFGEPSLENHTIYAPKTPPPPGVKLPVIVWSNGFCMSAGTMFANFLNEIASHGFFIVSNGAAKGGLGGGMTTYKELIKAMDWVTTNPAVKKYGDIDIHNIAVSGQSCGGMEAYQASPDPRVNLTVLFNSGNFAGSTPGAMAKQTKPVAWFLGGPNDMAQKNGDADYKNLGAVPALKGSIDVGHIGTYYQKGGGKIGRAAVAYFSWKQKGETKYKAEFCGTGGELTKVGWKFEAKNGMC
ncbi:hypothetical protein EJ06DRAFT_473443 [Trichodelitschia bisporula]|uniref:Alpha/beta-hydrolase n=1 Tax=Trichodelitschia bisporula TaxID=703511 RepID=A0A6G1I3L7_9PEZI|nr:hypothetical protein EJ06DRAFT_473443 [Trichodelitschia bisporula]